MSGSDGRYNRLRTWFALFRDAHRRPITDRQCRTLVWGWGVVVCGQLLLLGPHVLQPRHNPWLFFLQVAIAVIALVPFEWAVEGRAYRRALRRGQDA